MPNKEQVRKLRAYPVLYCPLNIPTRCWLVIVMEKLKFAAQKTLKKSCSRNNLNIKLKTSIFFAKSSERYLFWLKNIFSLFRLKKMAMETLQMMCCLRHSKVMKCKFEIFKRSKARKITSLLHKYDLMRLLCSMYFPCAENMKRFLGNKYYSTQK